MFEVYTDELFGQLDIEDFVRAEVESKAIVVIDEIDKLVRTSDSTSTTKASDEGVQYDLLPILDGTTITVSTSKDYLSNCRIEVKINTRNILFVGAGAFEKVKPTELAIELQGRLPIQAKMEALTKQDFIRILQDTDHNLLLQAIELLRTENVNVVFQGDLGQEVETLTSASEVEIVAPQIQESLPLSQGESRRNSLLNQQPEPSSVNISGSAVEEMAAIAFELNEEDNIGARRLRTVMDAVLEDINFEAPDFEQKGAQ